MWVKRFFDIKQEQLGIERHNKLLLNRVVFLLSEIKALLELNAMRTVSVKRGRTSKI